ncbi:MAG TPA: formate dehydrogenase subunit delta [Steroidobacteraceae bacterium]|nr:formate dehydrogenase subunit delta [Steroidobacteraceae bacterium]
MNIELLVKMANEIGAFFAAEPDPEQAARDVMGHLQRYWEPRMRAELMRHYRERQGAGLTDPARRGVGMLAASQIDTGHLDSPCPRMR